MCIRDRSLAEFNRKTHAALSEYDEIMDISYLYEMVLMELEEEQSRITNKLSLIHI